MRPYTHTHTHTSMCICMYTASWDNGEEIPDHASSRGRYDGRGERSPAREREPREPIQPGVVQPLRESFARRAPSSAHGSFSTHGGDSMKNFLATGSELELLDLITNNRGKHSQKSEPY